MTGTDRHRSKLTVANFTNLIKRRLPRPGFPHAVNQSPFPINQLPGSIPAQFIQPTQDTRFKARLVQRLLHKLRVIVFLDIFVLHDMDKRTCTTVFPGTSQFVNQPFRRIEAVAFIALLRPTFEDQARFGMTGGGIGVVFVDLQATFVHTEIHTTGDHMVTATLPGETQTWPEDFRNVEQRQQVVIF